MKGPARVPRFGRCAVRRSGDRGLAVLGEHVVDGFGHHNPNLSLDDSLFYDALAVDRLIEGLFRGRELNANEREFVRMLRMGVLDGREGYNMPMTASTRSMRYTTSTVLRVWMMYESMHQQVGLRLG